MATLLNKMQARTAILESIEPFTTKEPIVIEIDGPTNENLDIYHTRIDLSIQRAEVDMVLGRLSKINVLSDELNKMVINVPSPDEMGDQPVVIHIGKLKERK